MLGFISDKPLDLTMANDQTEWFPRYRGIVLWRGRRRSVRSIESAGVPLIGTELLWGSRLTAEMTDYGTVTIGPLPEEAIG